jgi:Tfp pilus assembly protein PilF
MNSPRRAPGLERTKIEALQNIQAARRALQRGERLEARRLAARAASIAPDLEDAWLVLAAALVLLAVWLTQKLLG